MYIVVVVYIAIRLSDFSARSVLVGPQRPESVKAARVKENDLNFRERRITIDMDRHRASRHKFQVIKIRC